MKGTAMFTSYDKAIAAFLTALLSILVMVGLPMPDFLKDPATIAAISGVLSGIVTYLVPNKTTAPPAA